jgi:hypothetical protein
MAAREAELLPIPYFHVVFTLPSAVGDVAYQNKAVIYDLLFKTSEEDIAQLEVSRIRDDVTLNELQLCMPSQCAIVAAPTLVRHGCSRGSSGLGGFAQQVDFTNPTERHLERGQLKCRCSER